MSVKHTILVITYNQQDLIGQCLDSIVSQSETPYEVIVADDCSPDNTFDIVCSYAEKYPFIRPYRNEKNLGIFGNFNKLKGHATGDFVNCVSGDDMLPEGCLAAYSKFIAENRLDCKEPFIICSNTYELMPNGTMIHNDNYSLRSDSLIELILLTAIRHWDTGLSAELVRQMPDIRDGIGYLADWLQHIERTLCCNHIHFINHTGYIYRHGIGVTAGSKPTNLRKSQQEVIGIFREHYSHIITPKIANFFDFIDKYNAYSEVNSNKNYFAMLAARIKVGKLAKSCFFGNWRLCVPEGLRVVGRKIFGKYYAILTSKLSDRNTN